MMSTSTSLSLPYLQRAHLTKNSAGKELFRIMEEKKSNLAIAADVINKKDLLSIAKALAPHICILKTHIDMLHDFEPNLLQELKLLAKENKFLILEDRKFADIGKTVEHQYAKGIYNIADWSDMVTVHSVAGPGTIEALQKIGSPLNRGILLLAEMSPKGSPATGSYTEATIQMAEKYPDFVTGFISQRKLSDHPHIIHMTPGIHLNVVSGAFDQQYRSPEDAILHSGTDVIIVGTGILHSENPVKTAIAYKQAGWDAYQKRINP